MEHLLNDGWWFVRFPNGSTLAEAESAEFAAVDLPHDLLISDGSNLYRNCDGWYKRELEVQEEWVKSAVILRFDGVYMDCDVLLNGEIICTHHYGYTAFDAVLTGRLHAGKNTILVHLRHQSPNSRWYSGAGIFRDVTLHVLPLSHIALDGTYVTMARKGDAWTVTVSVETVGEPLRTVTHTILDGEVEIAYVTASPAEEAALTVSSPRLWSPESPALYTLVTRYGEQTIRQRIGFRELTFTTDKGLFVNGEHVKLHGVCLHHDLGCLGAAFHEKAMRRQLLAMQRMGVNALRTSHNPPARQVMDLCDELGILVCDEAFDMWLRAKTTYDYARFFPLDSPADVASWVRRDRNHPCLLMWSIGNEIPDTHLDETAQQLTTDLAGNVRLHDPKGNAPVTIGSNYMPWEGARKCADRVECQGYNYGEKYYAQHHADHPQWMIYGSETGSIFSSRGIYRFPMDMSIMSDEDLQCSSLGNSASSWGTKDLCEMIVDDLNCPYSLGQFAWSGIDYIGEPTPYHTRSCYFGMMDTAVFPKDFYYLFQSLWTETPMVHIGVYWDWNPGQMIDVPVMTNGAECELFLNGVSQGRQKVNRHDAGKCRPAWRIPFESGELKAVAYGEDGTKLAEDTQVTPGDARRIRLTAEDSALFADGRDMTFLTIEMLDEGGHPVPNATDRVQVSVKGNGLLMGLDNGDSTDRENYQTTTRRLFSGKLLAVIGAETEPGKVTVTVSSPGKEDATLTLPVLPGEHEGVSRSTALCPAAPMPEETPIRKIELIPLGEKHLTKEQPTMRFRVQVYPENADEQPLSFRVTNRKGIESPCATCAFQGNIVTVTAQGDGQIMLRATANNGYPHARVISQQDIDITGLGRPYLNPYGFVSAGLYDVHSGDIGSGNEQGIAFARDGESMVGFKHVDFGPVGSDELELPIFALDSSLHQLRLWDGIPEEGGEIIAVLPYEKPSIWNVYQPETYKLPRRLTGVHTLCFSLTEKVHLKGFRFAKQSRAWLPLSALDADALYGDTFTRTDEGVMGIGNNVSLVYENMDFGSATRAVLTLDGRTPLAVNPITVRFQNEQGDQLTALCQFEGVERGRQRFEMDVMPGPGSVTFVFLPGCQFDFYGFQFDK